jgi:hypothetical protein
VVTPFAAVSIDSSLCQGSRLHHWLPPSLVPYVQDEVLSLYPFASTVSWGACNVTITTINGEIKGIGA